MEDVRKWEENVNEQQQMFFGRVIRDRNSIMQKAKGFITNSSGIQDISQICVTKKWWNRDL